MAITLKKRLFPKFLYKIEIKIKDNDISDRKGVNYTKKFGKNLIFREIWSFDDFQKN